MKKIFIGLVFVIFLSGCGIQFDNKNNQEISDLKNELTGLRQEVELLSQQFSGLLYEIHNLNSGNNQTENDVDSGINLNDIVSNDLEEVKSTDFVFIISNQSSELDPVDIVLYIDGKKLLDKDFDWQSKNGIVGGHNYEYFNIKMKQGQHEILVESAKGSAKSQKKIYVDNNKKWIAINYVYCNKNCNPKEPKNINIDIFDGEPGIQ